MDTHTRPTSVCIIGGGPAGLMMAERLAAADVKVTIYDQMSSVGRKFLMAGRGGLNLTHSESLENFMGRYGDAAGWMRPIIEAFPPDALREWCRGLGLETFVGSSGRVFPVGLKASPLLRVWLRRIDSLGVKFVLRHSWRGWDEKGDALFADSEGKQKTVHADAVVLALGGASWPKLGSDGKWVNLLRAQTISVTPLRPANCGFIAPWSAYFAERFAGQPLKPVVISFAGITLQGEAMISRNGLEGSTIYALSGKIREAIDAEGKAILSLDLRPGLSVAELAKRLSAPRGSQSASTFLRKAAGLSPAAIGLMRESLGAVALPIAAEALAEHIKDTKIVLTQPCSIDRAISTAGGIARDELDAHFMLKKKPGVFAIGEMLDWEAPTGGYLLQASFSMAVVAAKGVQKYLKIKAP